MSITDVIFDEDLHRPLHLKDAEAMVARLQKSIEAAKQKSAEAKREVEIVPGGLYFDGDGTAYLAASDILSARGRVRLWRLHPDGATNGSPGTWRRLHGLNLRPVCTASGHVLKADGTHEDRA